MIILWLDELSTGGKRSSRLSNGFGEGGEKKSDGEEKCKMEKNKKKLHAPDPTGRTKGLIRGEPKSNRQRKNNSTKPRGLSGEKKLKKERKAPKQKGRKGTTGHRENTRKKQCLSPKSGTRGKEDIKRNKRKPERGRGRRQRAGVRQGEV